MQISLEQLQQCVPLCPPALLAQYYPYISSALAEFEINTAPRIEAWIAEVEWECNSFRELTEASDGKAYEGRASLGNTEPGDGPKFIGRGAIQLTGRANYAKASAALGVDLVNQPELAATPPVAFRAACWFWQSHGLNELADEDTQDAFDTITRRINGGLSGKPYRDHNWLHCKAVLAPPVLAQ